MRSHLDSITTRVLMAAAMSFAVTTEMQAQVTTDPAVLQERLEGKLAAPFLRRSNWHADRSLAQRSAARNGRLIFVHCTRSFIPCGTSIRCESQVLSTPDFDRFAKEVELLCHVTAHLDKAQDRFLFEVGGSGWPHHVLMDASGRVVARHTGEKTVASFREMLERAQEFLRVERETETAIAAARNRRFEVGMAAGALSLAEARRLFASLGAIDEETLRGHAAALADLEIRTMASRVDRFDPATHKTIGRHFYIMHLAGRLPSSRDTRRDFWGGLLAYVETRDRPNVELYEKGLQQLEKEFGSSRGYKKFLEGKRKTLVELRQKAVKVAAGS